MSDYDLCVIGAGPSGFAAAMRAWDFGKRVALIEKGELGGAGVWDGALSSKTLWELSKDYRAALRRDRGFIADNVVLDYQQVVNCVQQALDEKSSQIERQVRELSCPRHNMPGCIELIRGRARFLGPHKLHVEATEGGDRTITADNFVIATGSKPRLLPGVEIDGRRILTSDHITGLRGFPRSLVVIGAGVVGCEFATIFANFNQTMVYLVDRADRILPFEDEDVSLVCSRNLEAKGVTIHHRAHLVSVDVVGGEVEYTIEHHTGGRETIRVEQALVSIGRVPNTGGLGLEEIGVELDDRGFVVCENTQTSVPHIHAVGDITHTIALVNVGEMEGRHAAEHIFGDEPEHLSYRNISSIYFLDPEVAGCGMSEQDAQKNRIPYRVAVYSFALVSRAVAMRATRGFVKILVTDCEEMKILGMRALGPHASTAIEAVSLVMHQERPVREIAELLHPHPAITEAVQDCVRMLLGTSIWKPHVFQSQLRLSRVTYSDDGESQEQTLRRNKA
jgi:dihydrolipoamide dehydrogenase